MKKFGKGLQQGFTLIEIMVVLGLLGILIAFLSGGGGTMKDDARQVQAQSMLTKNFPQAIGIHMARTNNCGTITTANLQARGVTATTPWGANWTSAVAGNVVTITYPLTGSTDPDQSGADLISSIDPNTTEVLAAPTYANPNLTITYGCQ